MKVKGEGGRILGSSDRARLNQNKERKGKGNVILADFSRDQGYIEVLKAS